ncbi:MAG TPA: amidase [Acetobacteraceae bacterium]|uniref:amidase n=1 Tax=Bradyrhizobium sp. TaxID=376 RepID=UPI002B87EA79|nr:amidase [Bradyrhizobium sp.]HWX59707.1 amidase [Bradyrhizobium sp.]HXA20762.1 amidase [Acetobacteraceae bacterium]
MSEIWQLSATDLAHRIARRQLSSAEVVNAHLARIDAVNPALNAVVRVLADQAREAADLADRQLAAGESVGPLHGVPFTVKENIDMAGLPTTWGVPALAQTAVPLDAPAVERMRAAGAIPIGRTNLPDMALRIHTVSSLHGITRNPWHPGRTAGGSSGGEAAALASGMSPVGLGNDIGGSLRNPANACGIASIRPSAGRLPGADCGPRQGHLLAVQLMNVQGPMARRVADVRLGLRVLMGAHARDPWSIDAPFEGPSLTRPIRVAAMPEPSGGSTHPTVAAAVRRAALALADAGYAVEEISPPRYEDAIDCWARFIMGDLASVLDTLSLVMGADAMNFLKNFQAVVPPLADTMAWSNLMVERHAIAKAWSMFMAERPLVLSPTWTQLPFEHGFDSDTAEGAAAAKELMRPVVPANLLGLPSACVPAGQDEATGLPIGVLITGRRLREDLCLDAAEAIETRLGLATPIDPVTFVNEAAPK